MGKSLLKSQFITQKKRVLGKSMALVFQVFGDLKGFFFHCTVVLKSLSLELFLTWFLNDTKEEIILDVHK